MNLSDIRGPDTANEGAADAANRAAAQAIEQALHARPDAARRSGLALLELLRTEAESHQQCVAAAPRRNRKTPQLRVPQRSALHSAPESGAKRAHARGATRGHAQHIMQCALRSIRRSLWNARRATSHRQCALAPIEPWAAPCEKTTAKQQSEDNAQTTLDGRQLARKRVRDVWARRVGGCRLSASVRR